MNPAETPIESRGRMVVETPGRALQTQIPYEVGKLSEVELIDSGIAAPYDVPDPHTAIANKYYFIRAQDTDVWPIGFRDGMDKHLGYGYDLVPLNPPDFPYGPNPLIPGPYRQLSMRLDALFFSGVVGPNRDGFYAVFATFAYNIVYLPPPPPWIANTGGVADQGVKRKFRIAHGLPQNPTQQITITFHPWVDMFPATDYTPWVFQAPNEPAIPPTVGAEVPPLIRYRGNPVGPPPVIGGIYSYLLQPGQTIEWKANEADVIQQVVLPSFRGATAIGWLGITPDQLPSFPYYW